jgi:hypothetical protein
MMKQQVFAVIGQSGILGNSGCGKLKQKLERPYSLYGKSDAGKCPSSAGWGKSTCPVGRGVRRRSNISLAYSTLFLGAISLAPSCTGGYS